MSVHTQSLVMVMAVARAMSAIAAQPSAAPVPLNPSFEELEKVTGPASVEQGFGVWQLGLDGVKPAGWTLNSAYPGTLSSEEEGVVDGRRFLRIRGSAKREAHIYQPCPSLTPESWYRVQAQVRGGKGAIGFYEYHDEPPPVRVGVVASFAPGDGWRRVSAYYRTPGTSFRSASLYIMTENGETVDVDAVRVEPVQLPSAMLDRPAPVLENRLARIRFSARGEVEELRDVGSGTDYAAPDVSAPSFEVVSAGSIVPILAVGQEGRSIEAHTIDPSLRLSFTVASYDRYFTLSLAHVSGPAPGRVRLCDLHVTLTESVGALVNAAWNDEFAVCVLACNDRTHAYGASGRYARLRADCYAEYGLEGAKIAIIACPRDQLWEVIGEVEQEQGLPHPILENTWIKQSPYRMDSYLMVSGASEANIDEVIEFARGGFGCIELLNWWHSTPSYAPSRTLYPNGLAGMRTVADKIRAAGMRVGLHAMQGMVGWGGVGMKDPYVWPKADPRLLQDRHATLATAIDAEAADIRVTEDVAGWPEKGDLYVDGELVRYAGRDRHSFTDCTRGLHGTTAGAHAAGVRLGHMVNCFDMWGMCIYAPDVTSSMVDEICDNLARVFNETRADMSYFDGGEEMAVQPPHWRNQGRIALGVMQRLRRPVILEGNALYTNLSWHVITRGSPSFDPIYYGRDAYTLRAKGQNPARWARDLLTGDVGWFAPHVHSPSTDAVTPDEVMLLCLKALGGRAPISFQANAGDLWPNKRTPEMLEIIRTCDRLKREACFSDAVCRELARPMVRHHLEKTDTERGWTVSPLQFGPRRVVDTARGGAAQWAVGNPYHDQVPWIRIRARTGLAPYGDPGNVVLADYAEGVLFTVDGAAAASLTQALASSDEKAPNGGGAVEYSARNAAADASGWCRATHTFDEPLDLSLHRRIGVWVRSDGKGGILNVQLVNTYGFRDHYIDLDTEGWAYHVLDPPEDVRFYDYRWPYAMVPVMYWRFRYHEVTGVNLYLNALPPGVETSCLVSRIEALREDRMPLMSPALATGSGRVVFPGPFQPDDYLELDWVGACRHFGPNGGLIRELLPEGELRLRGGVNTVRFTADTGEGRTSRAEVTLALKGGPLDDAGTAAQTVAVRAREPRPMASPPRLELKPGGKGLSRVVAGVHELASYGGPRSVSAVDGVANVWSLTNDTGHAYRLGLALSLTRGEGSVAYDDPGAEVLESFDDLAPYELSERNRFEQYVVGAGKQITGDGPVREGVSQSFVSSAQAPRVGTCCAVYTATNTGAPGGWSAKGRRFAEPVDLSGHKAVALWVHGDGKGEVLRLQFRDTAGRHADWLVPIRYQGWKLQVFRTAERKEFDWARVEYVLFYFNSIPSGATCVLRLDDLKAFRTLHGAAGLDHPRLSVNGREYLFPFELAPGDTLTLDGTGTSRRWDPACRPLGDAPVASEGVVLRAGRNDFVLRCRNLDAGQRDVSVRAFLLAPTGEARQGRPD